MDVEHYLIGVVSLVLVLFGGCIWLMLISCFLVGADLVCCGCYVLR